VSRRLYELVEEAKRKVDPSQMDFFDPDAGEVDPDFGVVDVPGPDPFTAPTPADLADRALETMGVKKNPDGSYTVGEEVKEVTIAKSMVKNGKMIVDFSKSTALGHFSCNGTRLTTLEGSPDEVLGGGDSYRVDRKNGSFNCQNNMLKNLKGAPGFVEGNFYCFNNKLASLDGAPRGVKGDFDCRFNVKEFTRAEVKAACNVGGRIIVR
jgi:hypothetical protein